MKLFDTVREKLGDVNIIAEDLGDIFDSVKKLLSDTGFPGMRVYSSASTAKARTVFTCAITM